MRQLLRMPLSECSPPSSAVWSSSARWCGRCASAPRCAAASRDRPTRGAAHAAGVRAGSRDATEAGARRGPQGGERERTAHPARPPRVRKQTEREPAAATLGRGRRRFVRQRRPREVVNPVATPGLRPWHPARRWTPYTGVHRRAAGWCPAPGEHGGTKLSCAVGVPAYRSSLSSAGAASTPGPAGDTCPRAGDRAARAGRGTVEPETEPESGTDPGLSGTRPHRTTM